MEKKKTPYSFGSNMKYLFSSMWKIEKKAPVCIFLRAPFIVVVPFLGIYLSQEVVAAVTQGKKVEEVLFIIAAVSGALILCRVCEKFLSSKIEAFLMATDMYWQGALFDKTITMDYENMENPEGLTKLSKAMGNCGTENSVSRIVAKEFSDFLSNLIGIILYGGFLFALSPLILIVVAATAFAGFFLLKLMGKWNYENRDNWKGYDRKLEYLKANSGDFKRAKDMRLYRMTGWFMDVFGETLAQRRKWDIREQVFDLKVDFGAAALGFLREGFAYGFLVFLIFARGMSPSDFVLYFGLIGGFSTWLLGLTRNLETLNRVHLGFCDIREFLDIPDRQNHSPGIALPAGTFSIEFQHVSYRYEKSEADTIHDLSFKIEKGEKIAIVGANGAGKTTLVKLMCGLYTPTQGRILIDGRPVSDYNIKDYYSLFSVVFQEIFLFPVSIARNVSASTEEKVDEGRVLESLRAAGLYEKVARLPRGIKTPMVKSVFPDAVELSGGETQKLALARALYKDGKALILDEPTAALDPIAESRSYEEYSWMAKNHTSVFISHRLASTQFCDRIFFLEHGDIVEEGTHKELLAYGGKYREMFELQSRYYREGERVYEV